MSSCLVLQAKDKLYIGADTSSSVFIDNKLYRLNNNTKKLFLLNANTVLYCAGNNSIAEKVVQHISSIYCRNDFSLISLKNWLIEMYPYKNKDKTVYDVEILIATFKNNSTIVYQMSQYKNYDIVSFEVSDVGVQILSAGIKNTECISFAENELLNKSGVKSIFRTTFNNLSCNYIGGCLDLYEITKNGAVKIFDSERIDESGIQYANEICNSTSVSLNAEVLVSKLIMSENLWLENDSGNYKFDDSGFTATSGKNTIKIQPNNSGELFSIYKDSNKQFYINSDGDVEYAGTLQGATGIFSGLLSGGEININNKFMVDKNGNVTLPNNATISWEQVTGTENVANKNDIPTDVNQLNDKSGQKWSTTVGENWIKTADVYAQNLQVGAAKIQGTLTASQIDTNGLIAENISADTISGKFLSGGSININDKFKVDSSGNVEASSGTFGGTINANDGNIGDFSISNGELSYGNFGVFGDSAQFMNISPKGKRGTVYMNSEETCRVEADWTFSSTSFGVNTWGWVFARNYNAYKDNSTTCIEGDCITVNGARSVDYPKTIITGESITINKDNKDEPTTVLKITGNSIAADNGLDIYGKTYFHDKIEFTEDAVTTGTTAGTEDCKIYKVVSGGDDDIPSAKWVKKYVEATMPDTSDYLKKDSYGKFNADFADTARYCENTATQSHTANMYSNSSNKMYYCPQGSARRFKTDIDVVTDENLDPHRLYDIGVVQFKYKPSFYHLPDDTEMPTVIGMIADDIDKIYPCACEYDEDTGEVVNWLERYMIPPMLYLIQEHQREIESLQRQIKELERKIS